MMLHDGTNNLVKIVASADGLQTTEDTLICSRHYSNTLFNVMRGGFFDMVIGLKEKTLFPS